MPEICPKNFSWNKVYDSTEFDLSLLMFVADYLSNPFVELICQNCLFAKQCWNRHVSDDTFFSSFPHFVRGNRTSLLKFDWFKNLKTLFCGHMCLKTVAENLPVSTACFNCLFQHTLYLWRHVKNRAH